MNDFLSDLKAIKGQMIKQNPAPKAKKNPKQDEFKEIFKDETELTAKNKEQKFKRLQDEFSAFIEYNNIKKI